MKNKKSEDPIFGVMDDDPDSYVDEIEKPSELNIKVNPKKKIRKVPKSIFKGVKDKPNRPLETFDILDEATNVVEVSEADIERFEKRVEDLTDNFTESVLFETTSVSFAYQQSTDYISAILRDVFDMEVELEEDTELIIGSLLKLRVVEVISSNIQIEKSLKDKFMDKLVEHILSDCFKNVKTKGGLTKELMNYMNTVGMVRKKSDG